VGLPGATWADDDVAGRVGEGLQGTPADLHVALFVAVSPGAEVQIDAMLPAASFLTRAVRPYGVPGRLRQRE